MGPRAARLLFPGCRACHALNADARARQLIARMSQKGSGLVEALIGVGGQWGLNGQGSARLAVCASGFASDIVCIANGRSVNAKDVMSVMSLRAKPGTLVRVLASGPDEIAALEALCTCVRGNPSEQVYAEVSSWL
ncbi:HPr family phosphocarrier protein [Paraburkholderia hospita]|uniref:HPr family phosphocarrier protein n=2 Tax=Paraburkholderia hospita TaxID=169430 RepID=UPI003CC5CA07